MRLDIEFSGGAELLFNKQKEYQVDLPPTVVRLGDLLVWLEKNLLQERPELFLQGKSVRPGILILINDVDYSLLGENDYILKEMDKVIFISSLHGG
ncbi:unnamed protein product [Schistosoma bovis]|uniref:Ubiquitin-related modifier 1 homolog n=6 Tax=Schistosoma TaxID=6181 RepID=G4VFM6_SCHMA|nr:hypothetical protein Smp_030180 [Schistosoma mansoni]RTG87256.1 ubiquitin related modifier 1 [Schistosoma bovis]CAH8502724.1 unnamed protein product [Schistosoma turkestanicum]CAH8539497.1 unnamed protein product [Schistosoma intercalatum]CAH8545997.1 unnamed protein product [Schistosoma rodhaini]CAH8552197.1 unnamed protein product [Schistosoma curassoni]CAH8553208.1 unnamed protein product [Schistosoma margrebowiei]CAH8561531.1 unnamed protein product [Schistosoma haematobium]|eukprot:XP_018651343.1 hypothetical protein Smp_030180 [Schistosoma mansoni]